MIKKNKTINKNLLDTVLKSISIIKISTFKNKIKLINQYIKNDFFNQYDFKKVLNKIILNNFVSINPIKIDTYNLNINHYKMVINPLNNDYIITVYNNIEYQYIMYKLTVKKINGLNYIINIDLSNYYLFLIDKLNNMIIDYNNIDLSDKNNYTLFKYMYTDIIDYITNNLIYKK